MGQPILGGKRILAVEETTVLTVEQNAKQTLLVADRGYVLETGKITKQGTGQSLLNDEHVKTAYLGV
jgi:branched-chain amino acid transport system ATP-binding protein